MASGFWRFRLAVGLGSSEVESSCCLPCYNTIYPAGAECDIVIVCGQRQRMHALVHYRFFAKHAADNMVESGEI